MSEKDNKKYKGFSRNQLIKDVHNYCAENAVTPTDFGRYAANNPAFFTRLTDVTNQGPTIETVERIYDYMNGVTKEDSSHDLFS